MAGFCRNNFFIALAHTVHINKARNTMWQVFCDTIKGQDFHDDLILANNELENIYYS